jgi:hypothetical protein
MATQDEIKAALAKLDGENDGHWTTDGLARLDVLKELGVTATRAELQAAAPGYSRANRTGVDPATEQPQDPAVAALQADAEAVKQPEPDPEPESEELDAEFDPADYLSAEDEVLEELHPLQEQKVRMLQRDKLAAARDELDKLWTKVNKRLDALGKETEVDVKKANAQAIRDYLNRQVQDGQRRHAVELKKAELLGEDTRSPIDRAMQRKTGFGHKRPDAAALFAAQHGG